ncbi:class II aldolase/adducin family protein [Caldicellulosiruptor saccharolyticus DSM 8903]|uniref:Class II aldolase/adducin family protein n=1 Tax=Caldicellulosiruptor saccharolyticus (strain ATCC 43494 / DSM 8903 / Tp8T 6331) TaxID=351627 RepID=A4XHU6_CALS8|nr:class II aldolase/adducin family protein [Caldicellulosiruptor saccharolyticus]ABP66481.1 class II aldolase/adducin family protein [Caldicellulosiruptor saccharolyticus DSM 8903]
MKFELLHPAEQIVMIMERIYGYGMTTTSGGNISIMDENGDIWITPSGIDKGSLKPDDIVLVRSNGEIVGKHKPSVELPFHEVIYRSRPDIKAIIHAHPPAIMAFSLARKIPNTKLILNVHLVCGEVELVDYALPGSTALGQKIADAFKRGINTAVLANHGIVVGAENLFKAFMAFETLDFCAQLEIRARAIGNPKALRPKDLEISKAKQDIKMDEFIPKIFSSFERQARKRICELIHRAYDQRLFTSTQGTFSQRLNENSFIITPYMVDRKYIEVEDIVRIENGYKEAGKRPSRSVLLHKYIYEKHPDVNAIIIAHPPNIMAFAVTDNEFDSKTIPETYIQLRNVKKIPFGSTFMQPKMTADVFSKQTPAVIVENDCVIVVGKDLLDAFDKLEVLEFTAKAMIDAKNLGEVMLISQEEIEEIEKAFKL